MGYTSQCNEILFLPKISTRIHLFGNLSRLDPSPYSPCLLPTPYYLPFFPNVLVLYFLCTDEHGRLP